MNTRQNESAPCGVFCGACPSFRKSCFGCAAANKDQRRTSWMDCKIRICCFEQKEYHYCAECAEFPCALINQKLIQSHLNDKRYTYRHEIPENVRKFRTLGQGGYLIYQHQKWSCPECGGRVTFYDYRCQQCGYKVKD